MGLLSSVGIGKRKVIEPLAYTKRSIIRLVVFANLLFLYMPLLALMAFSFNDSKRNIVWRGFTFKYYEKTGYDAAKWLCDYCWTNGLPIPKWNVHSANPVGRDNIKQLMENFEKRLND